MSMVATSLVLRGPHGPCLTSDSREGHGWHFPYLTVTVLDAPGMVVVSFLDCG